jgi:hypothetical protein
MRASPSASAGQGAPRWPLAWSCLPWVLALVVAVSGIGHASQEPDTSTRAVVAAAAAYIANYEQELTSILADELYIQTIVMQIPGDSGMPRVRRTNSEVFFMFAPGSHDWMAIRDVMTMDGRDAAERPDIREALRTLPAREAALKFKAYNSRFNIGRTYRNFNEPTLSVLVFDEKHRDRFSFDRKRVERTADAVLVTIAFRERKSPTLIYDLNRGRVLSTGEVVVEAGSGRIRSAVLRGKIGAMKLELTTTYAPDERLGIWVPAVFREKYEHGENPGSKPIESRTEYEHVTCEARYSNYRRFETAVRIK